MTNMGRKVRRGKVGRGEENGGRRGAREWGDGKSQEDADSQRCRDRIRQGREGSQRSEGKKRRAQGRQRLPQTGAEGGAGSRFGSGRTHRGVDVGGGGGSQQHPVRARTDGRHGVGAGCPQRGSSPEGPSLPDSASPPTPTPQLGVKGEVPAVGAAPGGVSLASLPDPLSPPLFLSAHLIPIPVTGSTSVSATDAHVSTI